LGEELQAARLRRNITLLQAAQETHISLRHLQNLEEGRYQDLPGGMYNRAFIRNYCNYLGLESQELLARYEKEAEHHAEKLPRAKAPSPYLPAETIRIPAVFVWSTMFLVSVVGLYFSRNWLTAIFSPYFSHPPAALTTSPVASPPTQDKGGSLPAKESSVPAGAVAAADPSTASVSIQAVLDQPPPGAMRLHFQVVDQCWMSVTGDGKRLISKLFQPGENQSFDANNSFELVLGNAGGVRLQINGKPARPLGRPGEVVRIMINPQNMAEYLEKPAG
jgi:cytoskeletal protein RodZ